MGYPLSMSQPDLLYVFLHIFGDTHPHISACICGFIFGFRLSAAPVAFTVSFWGYGYQQREALGG